MEVVNWETVAFTWDLLQQTDLERPWKMLRKILQDCGEYFVVFKLYCAYLTVASRTGQ